MQRDEVGSAQELVQLDLRSSHVEFALFDEWIVKQHVHAERQRAHRHLAAGMAEADQPERAARHAEYRLARRHLPAAGAHQQIVEGDLARAGYQQRHRVLGDLVDTIGRIVRNDDAGLGGCFEIDGINADAVARDDLAVRHLRHHVGRDWPGIGIEERVTVADIGRELARRFHVEDDEIGYPVQRLFLDIERIPCMVGNYNLRFCHGANLPCLLPPLPPATSPALSLRLRPADATGCAVATARVVNKRRADLVDPANDTTLFNVPPRRA
jgi:hypothetical protein